MRGRLRSRLPIVDGVRVGSIGLRSRRLRTALTAIGIAIGIAAMVAVVGISSSSRADLLADIDALGTDLLRVAPGHTVFGESATLPESARDTAGRIGPVTQASGLTYVSGAVRRSPFIDDSVTGGIAPMAADHDLLAAASATLRVGRFLDDASDAAPAVVLGADAARRLGITSLGGGPMVWIEGTGAAGGTVGEWFQVIGILEPAPLAPELDSAAAVSYDVAAELFGTERSPNLLYVRTDPARVEQVREVLARSVKPEAPNEVDVARPSDALEARAKTDAALRNLLIGLGAVALLVGGVGITNVMVISVLERRSEIGVRRALGATRLHIGVQFLLEALLLSLLGGVGGAALGSAVTAVYAESRGWSVDLPTLPLALGVLTAVAVGLLAGVSPAIRAARLDPAESIRPV
ncbi:MAG: ABC transporter permease [Actinobacteria bacterium]|nr:ABC transporter permease [Actinomycetota bacterium]